MYPTKKAADLTAPDCYTCGHNNKLAEEGKHQEKIQSSSPHLTQDTIWESDKNTRKHHTLKSQKVITRLQGTVKTV